jgi:hypothetical protein
MHFIYSNLYVKFDLYLMTLGIDADEEAQQDHFIETHIDGDYAPYPNKVVGLRAQL